MGAQNPYGDHRERIIAALALPFLRKRENLIDLKMGCAYPAACCDWVFH